MPGPTTRSLRMTSDHLDGSGLGLRDRGRGLTEDRAGDLLGIEAVGLAVHGRASRLGRFTSTTRSGAKMARGDLIPTGRCRVWAYFCLTTSTEISTAGIVPLFSSQCVVFLSSGQPTPGP